MIRKTFFPLIVCCIVLSAAWLSCSKDKGPTTASGKLIGKWNKVQYATDDNANSIIDQWELHDLEPGRISTLEFRKDSTGLETGSSSPELPFRWFLTGELTLLTIYNTGDTVLYKIGAISNSQLQLTTKGKFGLAGYYYEK